jgi:hypothetical protein
MLPVDAGADLLLTYLDMEAAGTDEPDMVIVLPSKDCEHSCINVP